MSIIVKVMGIAKKNNIEVYEHNGLTLNHWNTLEVV